MFLCSYFPSGSSLHSLFYIWILAMLQYYVAVLTQQPLDRCHNNVIGSSENVEVPFYCLKEA